MRDLQRSLTEGNRQKSCLSLCKIQGPTDYEECLLYQQSKQGPAQETVFQFVVPQIHRNAALNGCHGEAANQGQSHSLSLMQERFWWPGMARDLRNHIRGCGRCKKFEATPPVAPLKPLACSRPGELLHVQGA